MTATNKPAKQAATQLKKPTALSPATKATAPIKAALVAKQPPRVAVVTKAPELVVPKPKAERGALAKAKSPATAATPASATERAAAIKAALLNKQAPHAKSPPAAKASKAAVAAETPREEAPSTPPPPKKPARKSIKEAAGVSTDAVARRTGKNWDDWFEVLDNAGAATLDQRGIIAILAQKHGIGPWWQQMIAVGYESLRSKSDKPPAADGFQINSSCTLDAPLARVFRLWNDAGERARWLSDDRFVVRGTTGEKTIRARWGKGNSHVAVSFAEKSGRTQVSVEHLQIETRDAAEQMKAYWAKKLGLLDQALAPRR